MTRLFITLTSFTTGFVGAARTRMQRSERGAAAVEYGMLVALVAAVCVATIALLGPKIRDAFQAIVDALTGAGV